MGTKLLDSKQKCSVEMTLRTKNVVLLHNCEEIGKRKKKSELFPSCLVLLVRGRKRPKSGGRHSPEALAVGPFC